MTPEDVVPTGYDAEERYFHEKEAEQLKQMRAKLDAARKQRTADQAKEIHWMKCPKCGAEMSEIELEGIMIDKCVGCQGLFFDRGELELMLVNKKALGPLRKLFN